MMIENKISKIMGIDLGEKRIGIAMSESENLSTALAFPKCTLASWSEIFKLIIDEEIESLVIGWPLEMDGNEGRATRKVSQFLAKLAAFIESADREELPVVKWDERLTSVGSERLLREVGMKGRSQRKILDQVAATQILQSYLDSL